MINTIFKEIQNFIKQEGLFFSIIYIIFTIFITLPITLLFLFLSIIISILFLPFFHIPIGKKLIFTLPIKIVNSNLVQTIRPIAESYLKNSQLLFSTNNEQLPKLLYLNQKDIEKLPKELITFSHEKNIEQTVIITVTTRKNILGTYTIAKLLKYEVIEEVPEIKKYTK